jgi:hypothetical protein
LKKNQGKKIIWDYENKFNPNKYLDRGFIDVKDNVVFLYHRDCLKLFGYKKASVIGSLLGGNWELGI